MTTTLIAPDTTPAAPISPQSSNPAWARPAVAALLVSTALLYLWGLSESGWANAFYSAAAQAGADSWKAFFFGSSDAGNSITVDKTPAALWLMALSVRIFGLNSWAILAPEALCGVASVGVLYLTVRRWFGPAAGLLAGAVMALTPVAVLMFRFNNPDALLVLFLVGAAYATVRALETASARWLALAGALVGFGFLTKMLQALLVVPALGIAYLVAAPIPLRRRIRDLLIAFGTMIAAAGWWIAIVELVPASARPYIGGSQTNSILELALGYNGLGRLTGDGVGSVGGGAGGSRWGETGLLRLFNSENGGQISWLLPAALILLVAALALTWRSPRTDRTRSALIVWGGWLVVTAATFSLMAGIFHAYYSVALAPAVGAVVAIGAVTLWRHTSLAATLTLAGTVAVTAIWSWILLGRSADFLPWLRPIVLLAGLAAAVLIAFVRIVPTVRTPRWATAAALGVAAAISLAGPAAYAVQTAGTAHTGSIPTAGPTVAGGGFGGPGGPGGTRGAAPGGLPGRPGAGGFGGGGAAGAGGLAGGGMAGGGVAGPGAGLAGGPGGTAQGARRGGAMGGLLAAQTPDAALVALLQADADRYTWVAATVGSNNAAGLQLGSGESVMPIGGFNGSDPSPTLERFQQYVRDGQIHYFIGGGGFGAGTGSAASSEIAAWVTANYTATTVGGATVYDLTS